MTDQERAAGPQAGTWLARGVAGAAWRTPAARVRGWQWPPAGLWSWALTVFVVLAALGFTGGAIGQAAENMHVEPTLAALLGLAQVAPLLVAPRWPLAAWRFMAAGLLLGALALSARDLFWPWPVTSWLAMTVVLALVAASYDRQTTAGAGLLTALAVVAPATPVAGMPLWFGFILCGIVLFAIVFGDALGARYAAEAGLAEQAELRRQDLARHAVLEERARIARELHDVVAHHMSVVAMQAEAAPFKIGDLPPAARGTFEVIRDAAREALIETRRIVGLLREAEEEAAERAPQPGLHQLDDLAENGRQAGLSVQVAVIGMPRRLDAGVDLSAYRIVQEALSNASRYAPGALVRVEIHYREARLRVAVTDDGGDGAGRSEPGGGHGIVGMRERVAMLGGVISAGPREEGGFKIVAELPYTP